MEHSFSVLVTGPFNFTVYYRVTCSAVIVNVTSYQLSFCCSQEWRRQVLASYQFILQVHASACLSTYSYPGTVRGGCTCRQVHAIAINSQSVSRSWTAAVGFALTPIPGGRTGATTQTKLQFRIGPWQRCVLEMNPARISSQFYRAGILRLESVCTL